MAKQTEIDDLESSVESGMESGKDNLTSRIPVDNPASNRRKVLEWFRENAESYQYINLTELGIKITRDLLRDMQTELIEPEIESRCEYGLMVCGDKPDSHEWYLVKGIYSEMDWDNIIKSLGGKPRLHTHPSGTEIPGPHDYIFSLKFRVRDSVLSDKGIAFYPNHRLLSKVPTSHLPIFLDNEFRMYFIEGKKYLDALHKKPHNKEELAESTERLKQEFGIRFYRL